MYDAVDPLFIGQSPEALYLYRIEVMDSGYSFVAFSLAQSF